MKLALNVESAAALREFADSLPLACQNIMESTLKVIAIYQSISGTLGEHRQSFYDLLLLIKSAQEKTAETIEVLPPMFIATADKIDAYVASTVYSCDAAKHHILSSGTASNAFIASTMIANGLSVLAAFGELDSRTAKDIFMAVDETKQMFPELDLQFVGSAQARNKAIEADLRDLYLSAYRNHYPDVDDAELIPFVNQHVQDDMSCLEIEEGTIAQSLSVPYSLSENEDIISCYNGITINERYGRNYESFLEVKEADVKAGWKPVNCNTPKATVDHELGHQIDELVGAHNDFQIQALFAKFSQMDSSQQSKVLSGYAATNIKEFIAEAWSEYRNNPQCRECAKIVAARIIDLYDAKEPRKIRILRRTV